MSDESSKSKAKKFKLTKKDTVVVCLNKEHGGNILSDSRLTTCSFCEKELWLSDSTKAAIKKKLTPICFGCAEKEMPDAVPQVIGSQLRAIKELVK